MYALPLVSKICALDFYSAARWSSTYQDKKYKKMTNGERQAEFIRKRQKGQEKGDR